MRNKKLEMSSILKNIKAIDSNDRNDEITLTTLNKMSTDELTKVLIDSTSVNTFLYTLMPLIKSKND
jgi:hypothetical protein